MSGDKYVWKGEVQGLRFLVEIMLDHNDEAMVSLWCSEMEDFVESRVCKSCEVGNVLERMSKFPPGRVAEYQCGKRRGG